MGTREVGDGSKSGLTPVGFLVCLLVILALLYEVCGQTAIHVERVAGLV